MNRQKHLGVMLDCSRNGVIRLSALRRFIPLIAKMGYNTLLLYTEDTYTIEGEPYFGYLRGRYSADEIKEIDKICMQNGVELIPCIQTLAHLGAILRWPAYSSVHDVNDILLCGEEKTYALIDKMLKCCAECFSSKRVHIGMDEAHMVGLGKYLDRHGFCDRFSVLKAHLDRVAALTEKHGLQPMMWSDMFFRLCSKGQYYIKDPDAVTKQAIDAVPKNMELVYWDYYSTDKPHYDTMFKAHQKFNRPVWFAGGAYSWSGFAPHNGFSIRANMAALQSCRESGVQNIFITMWGDNGSECSCFALLPALYHAAATVNGITDKAQIKAGFEEQIGIPYDAFMLLDLPGTEYTNSGSPANPDKYLFYNDYFLGVFDTTVKPEQAALYRALEPRLLEYANHPEFGYLFAMESALCGVLKLKADFGVRLRAAYEKRDLPRLFKLAEEMESMEQKIKDFAKAFASAWEKEKKPHGFETHDLRIGGLLQRTQRCKERLLAFANGTLPSIPELEETLLDPECNPNAGARNVYKNDWTGSFASRFGW